MIDYYKENSASPPQSYNYEQKNKYQTKTIHPDYNFVYKSLLS